jgi:hypothetical protein
LSFRLDDLNSVGEPCTENYFRQLVVAIEATPVFLGGLGQLEDHGDRVPGFSEIGGAGLAAPRLGGPAAACSSFRAVAVERPPYARS